MPTPKMISLGAYELSQRGYTSLGYANGMSNEKYKEVRESASDWKRGKTTCRGNNEVYYSPTNKTYYQIDCSG